MNLKKNELGVYWNDLRMQLYKTMNFEQALGLQVFKRQDDFSFRESECK